MNLAKTRGHRRAAIAVAKPRKHAKTGRLGTRETSPGIVIVDITAIQRFLCERHVEVLIEIVPKRRDSFDTPAHSLFVRGDIR